MWQVERRHKAGFGAAGLGTAQSWFWSRHKAGFGAVGLGSLQSRFWSPNLWRVIARTGQNGDLRRNRTHYDVSVMNLCVQWPPYSYLFLTSVEDCGAVESILCLWYVVTSVLSSCVCVKINHFEFNRRKACSNILSFQQYSIHPASILLFWNHDQKHLTCYIFGPCGAEIISRI